MLLFKEILFILHLFQWHEEENGLETGLVRNTEVTSVDHKSLTDDCTESTLQEENPSFLDLKSTLRTGDHLKVTKPVTSLNNKKERSTVLRKPALSASKDKTVSSTTSTKNIPPSMKVTSTKTSSVIKTQRPSSANAHRPVSGRRSTTPAHMTAPFKTHPELPARRRPRIPSSASRVKDSSVKKEEEMSLNEIKKSSVTALSVTNQETDSVKTLSSEAYKKLPSIERNSLIKSNDEKTTTDVDDNLSLNLAESVSLQESCDSQNQDNNYCVNQTEYQVAHKDSSSFRQKTNSRNMITDSVGHATAGNSNIRDDLQTSNKDALKSHTLDDNLKSLDLKSIG